MKSPVEVLEAMARPDKSALLELGTRIGHLYTDHGLPIDMALDRLEGYSQQQKLLVLVGAQSWLVEHRRQSSATEKAIDRQRAANAEALGRFLTTGETGVY